MIDPIFWSILLLVAGLALIFLEIFVPSGGVIGFLAAVAIVAGIFIAFSKGGLTQGLVMLLISGIGIPITVAAAFKIWPHTPMGRRALKIPQGDAEVLPNNEEYREIQNLVGRAGRAKTKMLPSGAIVIDGRSFDAVSEGPPIDPQQPIRVTSVRTNKVIVRPISEEELLRDERFREQQRLTSNSTSSGGESEQEVDEGESQPTKDILSQPIDSLGIEPLDDPLA